MAATPGMPFALQSMTGAQQFFPQMQQNGFLNMNQAANFFANQQRLQSLSSSMCTNGAVPGAAGTTPVAPATAVSSTQQQLQASFAKALASQANNTATPNNPQGGANKQIATVGTVQPPANDTDASLRESVPIITTGLI